MFKALQSYFQSIGGDIVRVCTYGTETAKSAIQTAVRGLGLNNDLGTYLSSLMPSERGQVWSLSDACYGNADKDRHPVTELVNQMNQYEGLLETAMGVEGLISRRGVHACFDKDTLVTTDNGLKKIKDIVAGDRVLTHKNRFKTVGQIMTTETETVYILKTTASLPLEVTEGHPFYVRKRKRINYKQDNGRWSNKNSFEAPEWVNVEDLKIGEHFVGVAINQNSIVPTHAHLKLPFHNESFWWLVGRYMGDGWTETYNRENRVIICCTNKHEREKEEILHYLNKAGFKHRVEKVRTTYKIHIKSEDMYEYLQSFGKYAHGKHLNKDVFDLPVNLLEQFMEGYIGADGHICANEKVSIKTVSRELAVGIMQVINKAYHRHASIGVTPPKIETIEGRMVNSKTKYEVTFTKTPRKREQSYYEDGYIWTRLSKLEVKQKSKTMHNLSVYDDNSYVVHGLIAHNCGCLVINEPIVNYNAIMKAPNEEVTTQYTLAPSEYTGLIKYDVLCTKTCGMIQICMELLIKAGHMEWQGSLRATYDKYLHPDVIDSETYELWERLCNHELISAFQMDGDTGQQAVEKIQPHSIIEASNANTIMRLMCEGQEQPLDKYARYKHEINEWYRDMREYGLTEEEIKILEPLLLHDSGVCGTQESMMSLVMDENISNFTVPEANLLRRIVAKKKMKDIPQVLNLFYQKGLENGCRQVFLNYIWDEQIKMQLGYSFCLAHSLEYTWILVQQLNLIHYYPPIYWATAVLLIESGAITQDVESEDDNKKEKTTNYGVVATAISDLQQSGVVIDYPNINKAEVGFTPHEDTNSIMFGFKGVSTINNDTANLIIENRPFVSLEDFHARMVEAKREVTLSTGKKQNKSLVSTSQTINLIKAGAFDEIESCSREEILEKYLRVLYPPKKTLTTANINSVMELGIIPNEYQEMLGLHNFKKFISGLPKTNDESSKTIKWHTLYIDGDDELTDYTTNFFHNNFSELQEGRDYDYDDYGYVRVALGTKRKGSFEAILTEKIKPFTNWLNSPDCKDTYNHMIFEAKKQELMRGDKSRWEMESMNFYYSTHELAHVDKEKYSIVNFYDLPEEPEVVGFTKHGENEYPKFALSRICGTVLDRDKNKHTVTLLTEYGVVTLKLYSGQFSFYDKRISSQDEETGQKVVLEESWFKRHTLLMVTGYRRGNQFRPKRYKNSVYQHTICRITDIDEYGNLTYLDNRVEL